MLFIPGSVRRPLRYTVAGVMAVVTFLGARERIPPVADDGRLTNRWVAVRNEHNPDFIQAGRRMVTLLQDLDRDASLDAVCAYRSQPSRIACRSPSDDESRTFDRLQALYLEGRIPYTD